MNLFCGFVPPGCARPRNLEPVRLTESPFTSLNHLRAVEKFKINQLCPLGRGAGRVIMYAELSKVINHGFGNCMWWWERIWGYEVFTCGVIIQTAHGTLCIAKCFKS